MSFRQHLAASGTVNDRVGSLFSRVVNDDTGARTHVLCAELHAPVERSVLQARFDRMSTSVRALRPELGTLPMHLFLDDVPHRHDSAPARAQCEREAARCPAPQSEALLRAVQLCFEDGSAALIVTAGRVCIGKALLIRILTQLATGESFESATPGAQASPPIEVNWADYPPITPWAAAGTGSGCARTESIVFPANLAQLSVALSRVFRAFNQQPAASLPVMIDNADIPGLDTGSGWALCPLDASPALRGGVAHAWLTDERVTALAGLWSGEPAFLVGLFAGCALPSLMPGVRALHYQAFVRPPFPITLLVEDAADGHVSLAVHYDQSAIGTEDAQWLLRCLANVATAVAAAPDTPVAHIPLLDSTQQSAVLALGHRSRTEQLLAPQRIEQRIAERALEQPDAPAVSDAEGCLSYAELMREAGRLAAYLTQRGIGRADHVGLCVARSRHMVVAALAIMKAGAVYVPIDPDYPADRIAYTCEDAGLKLAIFDDGHAPGGAFASITMSQWLRQSPESVPVDQGHPVEWSIDDPAYMIYTSGSTGRPKGVLIAHRSVQALLGAVQDEFALTRDDVWSFFHSFAFDFSVWEVWGALLTGARVHVVSHETSRNPEAFIREMNGQGITVLSQTPSAFGQLMAADRAHPVGPQLRLVVFGGEALDARALLPWFDRHPESQCRLINMFGITETTVHVTAKEIRRSHALEGSRSVGRPINGWHAYVLGPDGTVLPPGIDGEIYVGGSGVALGYHNKPELNEQRFMPDLLGNGRMYRSGDRGRLLPSGEMLHLGRLDNQIKLRGFRIELDEIRNVLLRCRGVEAAAAVFSQKDKLDAATARIDAYIVLAEGSVRDVWLHASQQLPDYMLPTSIARVSSMPLTANGKLDQQKLAGHIIERSGSPERSIGIAVAPKGAAAPSTPAEDAETDVERHLVEIWSELFDQPVSVGDNFFDLGGNSLFAIRLSTKARERGLPGLSLRDLYVHQTISGLTAFLRRS
ncbi:non-ribosomal peptide synthetase [Tahibacter amnicola]|uniref:Non-ribosomal peptide synthetase n=1 Tax=Tahibacter amnicola TaxID=2976241 RepID=A0ABY6B8V3_9GAMM|nr:non-ribosomal peptide synthetase [Tahibacter amnicola]UXI66212.1 non-ribosomal peptide synthetase [Tahibacter amnicola]